MKWQHVATVNSMTEPGKQYEIKRQPRGGAYGCGCTAFRFARGTHKTCKHLQAFLGGEAALGTMDATVRAAAVAVDRQTVSVGGETFTVRRRAIVFRQQEAS